MKRFVSVSHSLYWSTKGMRVRVTELYLTFFYLSPRTMVLDMDVKEILLTCVRKFVIHSQEESSHLFVSAPSAVLPTIPSCAMLSTRWREGISSSRTWTGLGGGSVWTSWGSTRSIARSCMWVDAITSTSIGQLENRLRAAPKWNPGVLHPVLGSST